MGSPRGSSEPHVLVPLVLTSLLWGCATGAHHPSMGTLHRYFCLFHGPTLVPQLVVYIAAGVCGSHISQSVMHGWCTAACQICTGRQDICTIDRHASLHHQRGCPRFGFSQATNNMSEEALRFPTLCSAFESTHVGKDRLMCTVGCTAYLDFSFAFSLICCVHTLLHLCEMYIQNLSISSLFLTTTVEHFVCCKNF